MNSELINFYQIIKNRFTELHEMITNTLHSRKQHQHAWVIYKNPDLFDEIKRAWALWVLSSQGFGGKLENVWGYDLAADSTSRKIFFNKAEFTEIYSRRLEKVQLENTDALYIIRSRDSKESFFYCDPPYFNSNMGHYKGYTKTNFQELLQLLSTIEGKFLLSSYPSQLLKEYTDKYSWHNRQFEQFVAVSARSKSDKRKLKYSLPIIPSHLIKIKCSFFKDANKEYSNYQFLTSLSIQP